jgi:hypothetical protein
MVYYKYYNRLLGNARYIYNLLNIFNSYKPEFKYSFLLSEKLITNIRTKVMSGLWDRLRKKPHTNHCKTSQFH